MFDKTGQAKLEVNGSVYHVGRMKSADWVECSHILNDEERKIWRTVRPGGEMGLYMAMSHLSSSECDSIARYALKTCKSDDQDGAISEMTFQGGMEFYWVLVCKVVIANFTNFASMAMRQLAQEELWEEVHQAKADRIRKELVSRLVQNP